MVAQPRRALRLAVVGCPNVGKSVLFGHLTGRYVSVSNYPGTTVEVARGTGRWGARGFEIYDTPGLYSLACITDEERVARRLLLTENPDWLLHVVDGKNLERMLPLTLQLAEAGFRVLLVVNMMDEVAAAGLKVDLQALSARLGLPVVGAVLVKGEGVDVIKELVAGTTMLRGAGPPPFSGRPAPDLLLPVYDRRTEAALETLTGCLGSRYPITRRAVALLCLQGDPEILDLVRSQEGAGWAEIRRVLEAVDRGRRPVRHRAPLAAHNLARSVAAECVRRVGPPGPSGGRVLGDLLLRPVIGFPVLALVVYFGLYRFVGGFGAGTLVEALDRLLFLDLVNPWINRAVDSLFATDLWRELLAREYGLLTLGVRYAVAIVLPIVGTFFLAFAVLEDSGYLPRLALLIDRVLKPIGLSGRALIPLTLGLGCGTMATLVTRTLETRRERILATFLLALGVPCSAQLGVVMAVLSGRPHALAVWGLAVAGVLVIGGTVAARILPGRAAPFFIEVPPLRLPRPANIWRKTTARMVWYFREILPVFLGASVVIWFGRLVGLFPLVLETLARVCSWLGLPAEVAVVFLFGFLRRDYGAAGLYDLAPSLPTSSLIVAATTLTLFVPCLAQTALMFKERGARVALTVLATVFPAAIIAGYLLSQILILAGGAGW